MKRNIRGSTDREKQFLDIFDGLCRTRRTWEAWQDFVEMSACAIGNAVDWRNAVREAREDAYLKTVRKYSKEEATAISELLAVTTMALDENPNQDFLGSLYMQLNLGDHWHGQFFTPWSVSEFMAKLNLTEIDKVKEMIEKNGYISVSDPCCGAGGMLLAFASACKEEDVNYQESVLFVGQDLDPVVAKMCYIQMSLCGCPGYVVIGNSLTNPLGGTLLNPAYNPPGNIWFTPLYFLPRWSLRRDMDLAKYCDNDVSVTEATFDRPRKVAAKPEEDAKTINESPDFEIGERAAPRNDIPKGRPVLEERKPFSWRRFLNVDEWKRSERSGKI